ncbi:MAG TPA: TIR domain-containing protein [Phycisphaerae bacterium]|nr:TIR domain-containing protein [Phycisphaerae bacterium]HNU46390.1 TIR domain-containing protein [Phycisphaerae bacterium]
MDKLQVFISWSGERSHAVAEQVKTWLVDVVPQAEPWLSSEDLRKGLQWLPELNKSLNTSGFGLLVLTAENKDAPWLLFEAGVISKALPNRHCCPLLCGLKQTEISGPLAQFQSAAITSNKDMLHLAKTMHDASGAGKLDEERLNRWFPKTWDDFAKQVSQALATKPSAPSRATAAPSELELLEEILGTVRRVAIELQRARADQEAAALLRWGPAGYRVPHLEEALPPAGAGEESEGRFSRIVRSLGIPMEGARVERQKTLATEEPDKPPDEPVPACFAPVVTN